MIFLDKIRELIANGRTEDSIDNLLDYVKENNSELIDRIVLLKSRLKDLNKSVSNGTISDQDASLKRAKVNESVLKIISEIKSPYSKIEVSETSELNQSKGKKNSTTIIYILGLIIILAFSYIFKDSILHTSEENTEQIRDILINELIGEFSGTLDEKKMKIVFEKLIDNTFYGYNIVGTNRRPIIGEYLKRGNDTYFIELKEPGDDKWDGMFKITMTKEGSRWIGRGTWESYDNNLFRKVQIKKKN